MYACMDAQPHRFTSPRSLPIRLAHSSSMVELVASVPSQPGLVVLCHYASPTSPGTALERAP